MTVISTPSLRPADPWAMRGNPLIVEKLPHYAGPEDWAPAHPGDAGLDLYAAATVLIPPGEWKLVPCGIRIALPYGTEGQVRPKSGNALKKGFNVLNSPGTIDSAYRGEVMVIVHNVQTLTFDDITKAVNLEGSHGLTPMESLQRSLEDKFLLIDPGQKIAQLVISKYERPPILYIDKIEGHTERGEGGFGSTG